MALRLRPGVFYGKTSRSLEIPDFRFIEKCYSADQKLPPHSHRVAHYCFVIGGHYRETIGLRTAERESFAILFHPAEAAHSEQHQTPGRHFLVEIEPSRIQSVFDFCPLPAEPIALQSNAALNLATRLYHEFRNQGDDFLRLALEGLTLELMAETARAGSGRSETRPPLWMKQAKEILRECFSEPPSLQELSKLVGVHPVHLARTFRKFERCTVGDFVRSLRIDFAKSSLKESQKPLTQIALEAGFADHTHFSRSFKQATGMTPSEFRLSFRS